MNDTESKQLFLDIITRAEHGKPLEFSYITTWAEFRYYCRLKLSTRLIIKTLVSASDNLFNEYCSDIVSGSTDVNKLLAYSQMQDIIAFYNDDLTTIKKMLDEYDEYLGQGHFWHSFLGGERDLWNIR